VLAPAPGGITGQEGTTMALIAEWNKQRRLLQLELDTLNGYISGHKRDMSAEGRARALAVTTALEPITRRNLILASLHRDERHPARHIGQDCPDCEIEAQRLRLLEDMGYEVVGGIFA
jgi:hypothetical protein